MIINQINENSQHETVINVEYFGKEMICTAKPHQITTVHSEGRKQKKEI